jgi:hypothetical protein
LAPTGQRAIKTLQVGDMVITRDNSPQPIRWIDSQSVLGVGRFAPIKLEKGALDGLTQPLLASPQHRFLLSGHCADLYFSAPEVLVSAKHLINGHSIQEESNGLVTYLHMMFDQHEVVYTNGITTERFHAADVRILSINDKSRPELFEVFPELCTNSGNHGDTVRKCLMGFETFILAKQMMIVSGAIAA